MSATDKAREAKDNAFEAGRLAHKQFDENILQPTKDTYERVAQPIKETYQERIAPTAHKGYETVKGAFEEYVAEPIREHVYDHGAARGEDPEIDFKTTNDALFPVEGSAHAGSRRMSDVVASAAEAFAQGARRIDLADRYED